MDDSDKAFRDLLIQVIDNMITEYKKRWEQQEKYWEELKNEKAEAMSSGSGTYTGDTVVEEDYNGEG